MDQTMPTWAGMCQILILAVITSLYSLMNRLVLGFLCFLVYFLVVVVTFVFRTSAVDCLKRPCCVSSATLNSAHWCTP